MQSRRGKFFLQREERSGKIKERSKTYDDVISLTRTTNAWNTECRRGVLQNTSSLSHVSDESKTVVAARVCCCQKRSRSMVRT